MYKKVVICASVLIACHINASEQKSNLIKNDDVPTIVPHSQPQKMPKNRRKKSGGCGQTFVNNTSYSPNLLYAALLGSQGNSPEPLYNNDYQK